MITGFVGDDDFGDGGLEIVETGDGWEIGGAALSSIDVKRGEMVGRDLDMDNGGKNRSRTGSSLSRGGR